MTENKGFDEFHFDNEGDPTVREDEVTNAGPLNPDVVKTEVDPVDSANDAEYDDEAEPGSAFEDVAYIEYVDGVESGFRVTTRDGDTSFVHGNRIEFYEF